MDNNLDLNLSRCLVEKQNFTYTEVTNVCNGETYQVPHGSVDYIAGFLVGSLLLILIGFIGFMLFGNKY